MDRAGLIFAYGQAFWFGKEGAAEKQETDRYAIPAGAALRPVPPSRYLPVPAFCRTGYPGWGDRFQKAFQKSSRPQQAEAADARSLQASKK